MLLSSGSLEFEYIEPKEGVFSPFKVVSEAERWPYSAAPGAREEGRSVAYSPGPPTNDGCCSLWPYPTCPATENSEVSPVASLVAVAVMADPVGCRRGRCR